MTTERISAMDLHALLYRLRSGQSERTIAKALGLNRKTVRKYRAWAQAEGLLTGELPDLAVLHAKMAVAFPEDPVPQQRSSLEAYRDAIQTLLDQGLGPRLIYQQLSEQPGFSGSESAVYRLARRLRPAPPPDVTVRVETAPGEVAQVDFGEVTPLYDPETGGLRRTWAFCMVLAHSRHLYVEFVFDQKILTWLLCHLHAFEFFGAVPKRIVLDNLKAAIVHAYTQDQDAEVQYAYEGCAQYYGFLIDPCLPAKPQHKGKIESGVAYVQGSFMPLLPANTDLTEANRRVRLWLMTTAGLREHGTTHVAPLTRFEQVERAAMLPLPLTPYDPAIWKQVTLHRDGYVVFEKSFYSAPCRLIGQALWLRAGMQEVRLFDSAYQLIATHVRAHQPGERHTQADHLPAEKLAGLRASRPLCQARAQACGPATAQVVSELLENRPLDKLRTALRVLALAEQYTPARLEAACARGLHFGDTRLTTLKRILTEGLDDQTLPAPHGGGPTPPDVPLYARSGAELAQAILGTAPVEQPTQEKR